MVPLAFSTNKKFRSQRSAGRVMCTDLWEAQGIILLDFSEPGETVNSKRSKKTLIKLKARIAGTRSEKKKTLFLQHNNARPHPRLKTTELCPSLAGQCCLIRHIALTLHHQIFFCLRLYKKDCGDRILLTTMLP